VHAATWLLNYGEIGAAQRLLDTTPQPPLSADGRRLVVAVAGRLGLQPPLWPYRPEPRRLSDWDIVRLSWYFDDVGDRARRLEKF
ncbi:hypothetical protein ACSLVQ_29470, partial [Klebsiella pneumoniae]|uniref:hypothetical protein n=1 Tax=Klebsiella pneumoniae TaxID=573 RepID=UPI003EE3C4F7